MFKTKSHLPSETSLFDERSFFAAFSKDFKNAQHEVIIESPYITIRRVEEIAPLLTKLTKKSVKVFILTRNPNHHDGDLYRQAQIGIDILKDSGAKVVVCNDMRHRKLAVIDDSILWEGSLNLLSQNGSRELMRRTYSKELCTQLLRFTSIRKDLRWYNWR